MIFLSKSLSVPYSNLQDYFYSLSLVTLKIFYIFYAQVCVTHLVGSLLICHYQFYVNIK